MFTMSQNTVNGYAGKILRVDMTTASLSNTRFDENTLRQYIGGTGLGSKILYDEVPPDIEWFHPDNRLIIASGPSVARL
jgi:aldehyde:ferredoxin oxidoreductase